MNSKVVLMSFGFKYGMPNANYYFDVGFIKNPARESQWGFFSEATDRMHAFVLSQAAVQQLIEKLVPLLSFLATIDQNQIFAFGCNAGRHRSFILVNALADRLKEEGIQVEVLHRDANMG